MLICFVNEEGKQPLSTRAMQRLRASGPLKLQDLKGATQQVNVEASNSVQQTSFLKREEAIPDKIEIAISTPKKRKKPKSEVPLPKYVIPTILSIVLLTASTVLYILFGNKPFYAGTWKANLTDNETAKGVKLLSYEIGTNTFTEKLNSEVEGLSVSAKLTAKMLRTKQDGNSVSFKKLDRKIDEIQVSIPSILCQKAGSNCDKVKTDFENTFKEEVRKQDEAAKDVVFKISKLSNAQIKIESETEGLRILQKQ